MKLICLLAPVALAGALSAQPVAAQDYSNLSASLFGEYVIGEGDDDASADFNGEIDHRRGRLCYYLEIEDLDDASGIAIHQAEERADGPEVLPLAMPGEAGDEVCVDAEAALLTSLAEGPDGYYLVVSSGGHPDGAIRGQLHN